MAEAHIWQLLNSILSASVVAGGVSFFANQWSQRRQNRLTHTREQLERFYGPLVFLVRTNATILGHHQKLVAYGEAELGEKANVNWRDPDQVSRNSAEIDMLMVLQNEYGDKIRQHNMQMVDLIRSHYHLIDAEDHAVCQALVLTVVRLEVEPAGKLAGRLHNFRSANQILIVDPAFASRIETTFVAKQAMLGELTSGTMARINAMLPSRKPKLLKSSAAES